MEKSSRSYPANSSVHHNELRNSNQHYSYPELLSSQNFESGSSRLSPRSASMEQTIRDVLCRSIGSPSPALFFGLASMPIADPFEDSSPTNYSGDLAHDSRTRREPSTSPAALQRNYGGLGQTIYNRALPRYGPRRQCTTVLDDDDCASPEIGQ
jgi:hypothetical protein